MFCFTLGIGLRILRDVFVWLRNLGN